MPTHAAPQAFTRDIPTVASLKTGDVLFPRKVDQYRACYDAAYGTGNLDDHSRVEGVLHPIQQASSLAGFLASLKAKLAELTHTAASADDGLSWSEIVTVLKLFKLEFDHLVPAWFGGLSSQVLFTSLPIHPIAKLLMEGLSGNRSEGFFIGHSALVLRNDEGSTDDDVFVIEANITDFSHYGVSIHPYFCAADLGADGQFQYDAPKANHYPSRQMRGWVNRRVAMGEQVWHREHTFFKNTAVGAAIKTQARRAISDCAKPLLGLSYGILDNLNYGEGNRLYCFEFVDYVFKSVEQSLQAAGVALTAALRLDDQRTWDWLRANLKPESTFQKGFEKAFVSYKNTSLGGASVWDKVQGTPCPVFTAHMLFNSQQLQKVFNPQDTTGADTPYVQ